MIFLVAAPARLAAQSGVPYYGPNRRLQNPALWEATPSPTGYALPDRSPTESPPTNSPPTNSPPINMVVPAVYESPAPNRGSPSPGARASTEATVPSVLLLSPPGGKPPLPLAPPGSTNSPSGRRPGGLPSLITLVGSLGVVLGIFLLVAWCMRRAAPAGSIALPGEVFEVLGRAAMASRQQVHLLRCGKKLVLVSVTPAGAETLTEITDPMEVDRLAGLCQQARSNSATAAFRQVFGQLAQQRTEPELPERGHGRRARAAGAGSLTTHDRLESRDV